MLLDGVSHSTQLTDSGAVLFLTSKLSFILWVALVRSQRGYEDSILSNLAQSAALSH